MLKIHSSSSDIEAATPKGLLASCPVHIATPLVSLPTLASSLGVAMLLAKDESKRPLGSFKALGGVFASLRTLARSACVQISDLLSEAGPRRDLPTLLCASDGNHGLAVAAAARLAGVRARVYLPSIVPAARIARIILQGAEIVEVAGTYDDAVRAASDAARRGEGLLVADTGSALDDPVVADVMAGYGVMADEIAGQLDELGSIAPTHLFVQAGVGGLAAALTMRLKDVLAAPASVVIVEPENAACVAAALAAGQPVVFPGTLDTAAEMLSCGEASAQALAVLQRYRVDTLAVHEPALNEAPEFLKMHGGPATTPSGAAGLAGLRAALSDPAHARRLKLKPSSRVLLIVTEGPIDGTSSNGSPQ